MMTWPKPVQKPHPPILLGGAFPWAARRAIRYGDGWYPERQQRQPRGIPAALPPDGGRGRARPLVAGDDRRRARRCRKLKRFRDLGAVRVNVSLPAEGADKILPILDRWAGLIRQLN